MRWWQRCIGETQWRKYVKELKRSLFTAWLLVAEALAKSRGNLNFLYLLPSTVWICNILKLMEFLLPFYRALLGSVSSYVVSHATCPVTVVKESSFWVITSAYSIMFVWLCLEQKKTEKRKRNSWYPGCNIDVYEQ